MAAGNCRPSPIRYWLSHRGLRVDGTMWLLDFEGCLKLRSFLGKSSFFTVLLVSLGRLVRCLLDSLLETSQRVS